MSRARTLGILGTGLIGGSIGMGARRLGWRVLGADIAPEALAEARERGAIDESVPVEALYERCEVVVLASHLRGIIAELQRLRASGTRPEALVLDIGSVKAPVVRAAQGLPYFAATHPMAGSERSGAAAADPDLFSGRTWAYVPSGDAQTDARVSAFIEMLGGVPFAIGAEEHDEAVALTSHVPQLLATLFGAQFAAASKEGSLQRMCGPAAQELLRLSRSSPQMWDDIFSLNARSIAPHLRAIADALSAWTP